MERLILLQLMLLGHVTAFTYYKPTVTLERNNFIFNGQYGVDQPLEIGSLSELKVEYALLYFDLCFVYLLNGIHLQFCAKGSWWG